MPTHKDDKVVARAQANKIQRDAKSGFNLLTKAIGELNKNVESLRNIELLSVAHDVKVGDNDKKFYSGVDRTNQESKVNEAHIVESTARQEAGLRQIAKRIVLLHGFLAKDSSEETKFRLKVASEEHTQSLRKHRSIGMSQFEFMRDRKIQSISGLEGQERFTQNDKGEWKGTGKNYTAEEAKAERLAWDTMISKKKHSMNKAHAEGAVNSKSKRYRAAQITGDVTSEEALKAQRTIIKEKRAHLIAEGASAQKIKAESRKLLNSFVAANDDVNKMYNYGTTAILDSRDHGGDNEKKADPELVKKTNDILKVNSDMLDVLKGNALAEKEINREKRKNILKGKSTRFSKPRIISPSAVGTGIGLLGGIAPTGTTLATTALASKMVKDRIAKKAAKKVAAKAAAALAAKKVAEKLAIKKAKEVAAKKVIQVATKAVAVSAVKKVATKKVVKKVGLSTVMALAKKVAAKLGWSTIAKHLATKLPALALGAAAGPIGIAIAIAGAIWMAYDIYEVLQELDKATDVGKGLDHPLLKPIPEQANKQVMTKRGLRTVKVTNADALDSAEKQKQAAIQPSIDGASKAKSTVVSNSGNTSNSGNSTVINQYGSFDPARLNTSDLTTRVPVEGFITPGI